MQSRRVSEASHGRNASSSRSVYTLVRAGERVLKDVLGIVGRQSERLSDRIDVAGVPSTSSRQASGSPARACDELGVRDHGHIKQESRTKR